MTVKSRYEPPDSILQRIDQMIDELRALRQAVQWLVSKESNVTDNLSTTSGTISTRSSRRSVIDILADAPGHRLFHTSDAVDEYVAEERRSWES